MAKIIHVCVSTLCSHCDGIWGRPTHTNLSFASVDTWNRGLYLRVTGKCGSFLQVNRITGKCGSFLQVNRATGKHSYPLLLYIAALHYELWNVPNMSLPLGSCNPPGRPGATLNQLGSAIMSVISVTFLQDTPPSMLETNKTSFVFRQKRSIILPAITSSAGAGLPT